MNKNLKNIFILTITVCIDFLILHIPLVSARQLFDLKLLYALINLSILVMFIGLLYSVFGRLWVAELIFSGVCAIYSVINVYVIEFHRTPLTIPEFANTKTALNVLGGYSFIEKRPLLYIVIICIFMAAVVYLIKLQKSLDNNKTTAKAKAYVKRIVLFLCASLYIIGIMRSNTLLEPFREGWHFSYIVKQYGYPLYFLASALEYKIEKPDGYSQDSLEELMVDDYSVKVNEEMFPDIILILNESFYDISIVTEIETDLNYMGNFFELDNSISGYAIVPEIGGGTNKSEYELLTSNSTYLLHEVTPFQVLDMSLSASLISNLKELGYYAIAAHPDDAGNYSRNIAYPALGFDEIYFEADFTNKKYYGDRERLTDECAYNYMIQWYEKALEKEKPIFSYLLTIQNHGDWKTNVPEKDIVHVLNYHDVNEKRLNEYLSCIKLSTKELDNLVGYFREHNERPVILCMVGDHAPLFIDEIADKDDNSEILQRATPFVIWANFPVTEQKNMLLSINELGPLLLKTAGVEMIPYYQFISRLGEEIPIMTSYGYYFDEYGNSYLYEENTKYKNYIQQYFGLEYNNLQSESLNQWFSLTK